MLTLNKLLKPAAVMAATVLFISCGQEFTSILQEEEQTGRLVLNFDIPEYKSAGSSEEDRVSIIGIYIFDAPGNLVSSRVIYGREHECEIMLDRGRYEYRILTGSAPGGISSIRDYDELLVDFYANIYRDSYPGFAMTACGSVDVHGGDNNVNIVLTRLCGKISVREIKVRKEIPGVISLQARRVYIHNAPTCVHTDGSACGTENGVFNWWDGRSMNFTNDDSVYRCTVASMSGSAAVGQSIYPEAVLYSLPTREPVNSGDFWTDSYLVLEMEAINADGSRQLHYYRKAIHLRRNVHMECRIAIDGPGSTSPEETQPEKDDLEFIITVLPWIPEAGYGHSDAVAGPMSYTFTHPADGNDGSIHFNNLYGEPYVRSSDRNVLEAVGAGREWLIINTGKGRARLELYDGYNREYTQELEY